MSTAVLYSGQFRSFDRCLPTQHWSVFQRFPDLHFYLVMQATPDAPGCVKMLEDKYGKERVHAKLIADPTDLPMIPLKYGLHAPYANAAPHPQLLMQHWYQNEVWKFYCENGSGPGVDFVIRMRADNYFHHARNLVQISESNAHVRSPYWGRFGGLNDRFAVMNPCAAETYFTVYPAIQKMLDAGCPFHPESLLYWHLEDAGVTIEDWLDTEFSTLRTNGSQRFPEITAGDIAHFARH